MRRWIVFGVAAAASGVVISQGVAYVCVAGTPRPQPLGASLRSDELLWPGFLRGAWPDPRGGVRTVERVPGHTRTRMWCPVAAPPDFRDDPPTYSLSEDSFGWPARSLVMYRASVGTNGSNGGAIDMLAFFHDFETRAGLEGGVIRPRWLPQGLMWGSFVPAWPLWSGLVWNTALYGSAVLVMLVLPARLRRIRRHRCGQCVGCGYDLSGLGRCPECGTPASPTARRGPVVVSMDSRA